MTPKRGPRFKAVLAMFLSVIPAVGQAQTGNIRAVRTANLI